MASWPVLTGTDMPLQVDGTSCGVFVLAVADYLAAGATPTFCQSDISVLRQRLALSLLRDDLTTDGNDTHAAMEALLAGERVGDKTAGSGGRQG